MLRFILMMIIAINSYPAFSGFILNSKDYELINIESFSREEGVVNVNVKSRTTGKTYDKKVGLFEKKLQMSNLFGLPFDNPTLNGATPEAWVEKVVSNLERVNKVQVVWVFPFNIENRDLTISYTEVLNNCEVSFSHEDTSHELKTQIIAKITCSDDFENKREHYLFYNVPHEIVQSSEIIEKRQIVFYEVRDTILHEISTHKGETRRPEVKTGKLNLEEKRYQDLLFYRTFQIGTSQNPTRCMYEGNGKFECFTFWSIGDGDIENRVQSSYLYMEPSTGNETRPFVFYPVVKKHKKGQIVEFLDEKTGLLRKGKDASEKFFTFSVDRRCEVYIGDEADFQRNLSQNSDWLIHSTFIKIYNTETFFSLRKCEDRKVWLIDEKYEQDQFKSDEYGLNIYPKDPLTDNNKCAINAFIYSEFINQVTLDFKNIGQSNFQRIISIINKREMRQVDLINVELNSKEDVENFLQIVAATKIKVLIIRDLKVKGVSDKNIGNKIKLVDSNGKEELRKILLQMWSKQ